MRPLEKALLISAFFYVPTTLAFDCPADHFDEIATVKSVHDGDTLKLSDGRKIRLIGINTPELARDNQPAEPYAEQARNSLNQLIKQSAHEVKLVYGRDRKDKYRRTLAHLYLSSGQNIQAQLIKQGLATAFTTPPNDHQARCYRALEQTAIQQQLGIWSLDNYQILLSDKLPENTKGFHRIEGQVLEISQSKKSFWIHLHGNIRIRIAGDDLKYFDLNQLQQLKDKTIRIRGWLHPKKKGYFINLRHPDSLSLISPLKH
ncbi:MAG: thermonuclease family protein [Gammaproteobacteria bacterium]|nr:thermonuclease family protein [Gammaproteobacteria bacterium]MCW8910348.1 thermonuclease family protein [Gammaproteobacteria bacterium]MCW9005314.1 thermonuclease family protein [Gammaproteobacteria bacterium]MCW9057011.1 thermonuclease family protein [Gammaproteobacteria bacterium]